MPDALGSSVTTTPTKKRIKTEDDDDSKMSTSNDDISDDSHNASVTPKKTPNKHKVDDYDGDSPVAKRSKHDVS